ncbi:hypothetical protein GCM10022419_066900 [Nonomuraea rosea]|uniref:Uncharacterized protein n=1 Tax=Nonomuraea rosea TaxID=638574 RepID=A0ABP6Y2L8_9ACTN
MAALTAGVSWLTAGPSPADSCPDTEHALLSSSSIAAHCGKQSRVRINDGGKASSRMVTTESNKLAMAAGDLARQLGLTGLATGKSALGTADLGGVAATWGMPSLASGAPALFPAVPGPIGMKDLSTMAGIPALPALPALPQQPLQSKVPSEMSLGQSPYHNRVAGTGIQSPLDLEKPVYEVGADVIGVLLPKAVESVEGTSMLPGGQPVVEGFTGLAHGLGLR